MSNVISWVLVIDLDEKSYKKLVKYLGNSVLYDFEAEPTKMMESTTCSRITISCSWSNNLKVLSKWIDKNISDETGA